MSDNLREFQIALGKFADKTVPEAVRDRRDAMALDTHKGVVLMTPVDTGRARANWQMTAGVPAEGADVNKFDKSGAITIGEGAATVAAAKDPWMPIWLHNGLAYIKVLNDGGVNRTAHHMVENTVARIRRIYK